MNEPRSANGIKFNCQQCGQVLQVPAEAAGRQAQCPQCGSVQKVVQPQAAPANPPAPPEPEMNLEIELDPAPAPAAQPQAPPQAPQVPPLQAPKQPVVNKPAPETGPEPDSLGMSMAEAKKARSSTDTSKLFDNITNEISKVYVGQDELVLGTLVALFSSGHVLIESVPGLGKTLFVRTLGKVLGCDFGRIQFTADLMPSDITGAPIFDMKMQEFRFRAGPVFTQLLLADEINRSPAKTHAALLEIMQEYRVTIDGTSHSLKRPFLVLATQNPIESEGTYNLPEAQLDRFMFKLVADYPQESEEAEILKMHSTQVDLNERLEKDVETITNPEQILQTTQSSSEIRVDEKLIDYVNQIVRLTRKWPQFHMGASPRAGIALVQAARTLAAFSGRDYAIPDDIVRIALPALRHRVILTAEAEVEGHQVDSLLTDLIRSVEVPRI